MNNEELSQIITLRAAVGMLGEKDHQGWWDSSFFGKSAAAFLGPVFPRTLMLSQVQGVTTAAMKIHDDRIGVGQQVFHLFRLPEDMEQAFHRTLHDADCVKNLETIVASADAASSVLSANGTAEDSSAGPVHVGDLASVRDSAVWQKIAAIYSHALTNGQQTFPYFSDLA